MTDTAPATTTVADEAQVPPVEEDAKPKTRTKAHVEQELADALAALEEHREMLDSVNAELTATQATLTESAEAEARAKAELDDAIAVMETLQSAQDASAGMAEKPVTDSDASAAERRARTVYGAWNRVMDAVQSISKDSRNSQQNFNFRGIDAVMNAVGPVLRVYGVAIVPRVIGEHSERYETAPKGNQQRGTQMVNRTVEVEYTVYGPEGDSFTGSAFGEAADSGDKAMAKAMSVAYRTFLLQALTIPTDEPDPDAEAHNRAPAQNSGGGGGGYQSSYAGGGGGGYAGPQQQPTVVTLPNAAPAPQPAQVVQQAPPPAQPAPVDQATAQPQQQPAPEHNAEARARLMATCAKFNLDPAGVAAYFAERFKTPAKFADSDTLNSFVNLIETGSIRFA